MVAFNGMFFAKGKNLKNLGHLNSQTSTYIYIIATLTTKITQPRKIVISLSVLDELIPDNQFYNLIYKLRHNRFWVDYFSSTNLQSNNILEF